MGGGEIGFQLKGGRIRGEKHTKTGDKQATGHNNQMVGERPGR